MSWRLQIEDSRYVLRPRALPGFLELRFVGRGLSEPYRTPAAGTDGVTLDQVHGTNVETVTKSGMLSACDGVFTQVPDLQLLVRTADCLPVAMSSPEEGIALVHAGWRGLAGGVLETAVEVFKNPEAISVWIGPGIGPCCFEVGPEVAEKFPVFATRVGPGRPHVDLVAAAVSRLVLTGIPLFKIHRCSPCTRCNQHFLYSHRGSRGAPQRIIASIRRLSSAQEHPQES